tara:strand:+ start:620 stop:967 length:348 start_codon:yes stop_codon:yes gene_type:complete
MADFKMNSDKYLFKKKLGLRRKSKKKLFIESTLMFFLSLFLVYINYLIPNKNLLLQNLGITLNKCFLLIIELILNLRDVIFVIFMFISVPITLALLIGSVFRLFRILKRRKSNQL